LGISLATIAILSSFKAVNIIIFIINFSLVGIRISTILKKDKVWGTVVDVSNNQPISRVKLALIDKKLNKAIAIRVTDELGCYQFLAPPGSYVLNVISPRYKIAKAIKQGCYNGGVIRVDKGIKLITPKISVERKRDWEDLKTNL
jgi:hypothetical protein